MTYASPPCRRFYRRTAQAGNNRAELGFLELPIARDCLPRALTPVFTSSSRRASLSPSVRTHCFPRLICCSRGRKRKRAKPRQAPLNTEKDGASLKIPKPCPDRRYGPAAKTGARMPAGWRSAKNGYICSIASFMLRKSMCSFSGPALLHQALPPVQGAAVGTRSYAALCQSAPARQRLTHVDCTTDWIYRLC
jgi:hypothetical protein